MAKINYKTPLSPLAMILEKWSEQKIKHGGPHEFYKFLEFLPRVSGSGFTIIHQGYALTGRRGDAQITLHFGYPGGAKEPPVASMPWVRVTVFRGLGSLPDDVNIWQF